MSAVVSPCLLGAGMKHDLESCILEDDICKTGLSAYIGGLFEEQMTSISLPKDTTN